MDCENVHEGEAVGDSRETVCVSEAVNGSVSETESDCDAVVVKDAMETDKVADVLTDTDSDPVAYEDEDSVREDEISSESEMVLDADSLRESEMEIVVECDGVFDKLRLSVAVKDTVSDELTVRECDKRSESEKPERVMESLFVSLCESSYVVETETVWESEKLMAGAQLPQIVLSLQMQVHAGAVPLARSVFGPKQSRFWSHVLVQPTV